MLKKALLKVLMNASPEEKEEFRKALGGGQPLPQNVGETQGGGEKKDGANAEKPAQAVETEPNADTDITEGETTDGAKDGNIADTPVTETQPTENAAAPEQTRVGETSNAPNGILIEDLVTKDMFTERLAAFDAKLSAFIDAEKAIASLSAEKKALEDKYENPNFGTQTKKGAGAGYDPETRKSANQSFEEYSKRFNQK